MTFYSDYSLQALNTFGIDAKASYYASANSIDELRELLAQAEGRPVRILGGGSNILLTHDIAGIVIHNNIQGITIKSENETHALVCVGGGVNWHQLVLWCLQHNLGGIENLSLIPGTVGAAPIQNIGAYGVEIKDVFRRLEAVSLEDGSLKVFKQDECRFGYRDSIFKREAAGKYFIAYVYLQLTKKDHRLNTSYGAIRDTLHENGIEEPTIHDVSEAVISIRSSKLPDPTKLGNAGSFFKNPEIPIAQLETLQQKYPRIVHFSGSDGLVKVPAGWLIEQCGWKGFREGPVGCYDKQALVLVNYGGASGRDVFGLAQRIINSVENQFGIRLTPEVNIW
jgi:UDP-N-acetylmuramate dehydrogenase